MQLRTWIIVVTGSLFLVVLSSISQSQPFMMNSFSIGNTNVIMNDDDGYAFSVRHHHADCLKIRGLSGKWVRDWNYANVTHYDLHNPTSAYIPTPEAPFRWETSWAWKDDNCDMRTVTREGLCRTCHKLGLTRVFLGGDSLTELFHLSLLGLIDEPREFHQHYGVIDIRCGARYRNIAILFGRFDRSPFEPMKFFHLPNGTALQQLDFTKFIMDNPYGTAIVLNTGAHFGGLIQKSGHEIFHKAVLHLLEWMEKVVQPEKDIVFARNTVVGHPQCEPKSIPTEKDFQQGFQITPIANYATWETWFREEMKQERNKLAKLHGWENFEYFNDYTKRAVENFTLFPIHWINIWNMTVLRRDGHLGATAYFHDCLHYHNPGPTDWWVHVWYSNLHDIAAASHP